MTLQENIDRYFDGAPFAVVGASRDRTKYGNKVLRAYQRSHLAVYPVNPTAGEIEGLQAYASLADLPETPHGISIVTPPPVTESVIAQAGELGIRNVWLQPGSESSTAVQLAERLGMNVIAGGPCVLVALGYRE